MLLFQYGFIGFNKCTTVMKGVHNGGKRWAGEMRGSEGLCGNSVLSDQLFSKPTTALQIKVYEKKK